MKFNITYERDEIYQSILVEAREAGVAADYLRDQMPNARVLGVREARSDDMKPGKPVMTVPDDFMAVKIEVGAVVFAENDYLEGVVVVEGDPYPFDYNIKTGEIDIHSYSAPGWLTGSSYEKPLPPFVTDNMEGILDEIQYKVDELLEKTERLDILQKYSEKEIFAAIIAVEDILNMEGFSLIEEIVEEGIERKHVFQLDDNEREYSGCIWNETFSTLLDVMERLELIHEEKLQADYDEFAENGLDALDPMVEKALILIENHTYIRDLFGAVDVDTRDAMRDKYYGKDGGENIKRAEALFNYGPSDVYVVLDSAGRLDIDALGYLTDRLIAAKIMDTQSAYEVIEYNGQLCEVYVDNGDISDFAEVIKNGTLLECDGVCAYDSYRELIDAQKEMILEDFRDIGLYDDKGNWNFYLTEKELVYIGLGAALAKEKEEHQVSLKDMLDEAKDRADEKPALGNEKEIDMI